MAQKAAAAKRAEGKKSNGSRSRSSKTVRGNDRSRAKETGRVPFLTVDRCIDGVGILLTFAGVLTGLAMIPGSQPSLVQPWLDGLSLLFGVLALAAPLSMIVLGLWLIARRFENAPAPPWYRLFGAFLFIVALFGFLGLVQAWRAPGLREGYGGLTGLYLARGLTLAIGRIGATVALFFCALLGLLFLSQRSLADISRALLRFRRRAEQPSSLPSRVPASAPRPKVVQLPLPSVPEVIDQGQRLWNRVRDGWAERKAAIASPPTLPIKTPRLAPGGGSRPEVVPPPSPGGPAWNLPPWTMLLEERLDTGSNDDDIRHKTHIIEETLSHFGVPARVVEINRGPTVTQYGVEPGFVRKRVRGEERDIKVKISAITNLHNDLALALAAQRIRIEAPVPGQSYVGIEVPNDRAAAVTLRDTMETEEFQAMGGPLGVALGRDVMGNAVVADLSRMPHLLIAGSTGSGKSVCINGIICSLLCHNTPDQLKLLMVDPKMVELIGYNGIPHLIVPVVTDLERVVGLLRWTVSEMERRYKLFSEQRVRNLQGYNARALKKGERPLPYLVLIIDELADLMMVAADQVEGMICRLAQMARATGIHLILATQRPSVDVVTGLIKANFPARIAFAVTSQIDSRVILDRPGAESLLGRGDMLYMAPDSGIPKRAQGCFVSDQELELINRHWLQQAEGAAQVSRVKPAARDSGSVPAVQQVRWDELLGDDGEEEEDELLPKAREIVAKAGSASISMLQRRLRVGYARAARIVDLMEEEGTIGSSEGPGKTREVYTDELLPGSDDDPGYDPSWVDED